MIALISDIHGNYTALKAVLNEIDKMGINDIYCLGDIVGYYTQVNECCDEIRRRDIKCIIGNHDWYLIAESFCPRSQSVNDCLAFQRETISREHLDWLSTLPVTLKYKGLSMVHGGWTNPVDEYIDPTEDYFSRIKGSFFASGHTHRQIRKVFKDKIYCNPGSVGQPRDNNPEAAFATFCGNDFYLHRIGYDIEVVTLLMKEAGFDGYYSDCLKVGAPKLGHIRP